MTNFILAVAFLLSFAGQVAAQTVDVYYVNKSGSDANSCATAQSDGATAKLTINAGIACAVASGATFKTVSIGAGDYDETILNSPSNTTSSRN